MLTWEAHTGAVTSLAFVPGGGLLSTGTDGNLRHWDALSGSEHYAWKLADPASKPAASKLLGVIVDASGNYAAVGLWAEGVRFFDLLASTVTDDIALANLRGLTSASDGHSLFVVGCERATASRRSTKLHQYTYPPCQRIASSDIAANSGTIIPNPNTSEVLVGHDRFRWPTGEFAPGIHRFSGGTPTLTPDGEKLFGHAGSRLMVWGFQTGAFRQKLKGHLAPITGLTTTPDGRKLWTASADATVRQWDVDTYRCEKCYGLKIGPLGCVAVSADGLTAAAGSAHNGHIAVWDLD